MDPDGTKAARSSTPGIKGEARRAAHDRPLGRALLRRLGKEFLSEVRHHKAPKPGAARAHPAALRCPLTSRVERIAVEAEVRREVSVKPHPALDLRWHIWQRSRWKRSGPPFRQLAGTLMTRK